MNLTSINHKHIESQISVQLVRSLETTELQRNHHNQSLMTITSSVVGSSWATGALRRVGRTLCLVLFRVKLTLGPVRLSLTVCKKGLSK